MVRFIVMLAVLLMTAVPVFAQEATEEATAEAAADTALPAGCNVGTLSQIFTATADSLSEETLTREEVVLILDMLDDSLAALRETCGEEETAAAQDAIDYSAIPQSRTEDGGFVLGDPDAPVTIVEFADFMCPHCQTYHGTVQELIREYVATGQAKFEYRFFPVVNPDLSPLTAAMVECAEILNPGSFWHAHDVMYELTAAGFNTLTPLTFATRAGIDYEAMVQCVQEDAGQVFTDVELAQASQVTGTPSVMVRYGDGELEDITDAEGQPVSRASVPLLILAHVIEEAQ